MSTRNLLGDRILVVGSPGAGKTSLSRQIAKELGHPHIELDDLYWGEDWTPVPLEQWQNMLRSALAGERWIVDGHYGDSLALRLQLADSVVYLDLPTHICLWRVARRAFSRLLGDRLSLPRLVRAHPRPRANHRFLRFARFVVGFRRRERPKLVWLLRGHPRVVRLASPREVQEFEWRLRSC
ncbi:MULTISPECIES: AAA family ATPase [Burkholderia cepacia complex]|uniref:Topology modulation protein n=1 Tax=Burkholderia stabilis TaxID=95485 RepID=A0AAJ5NM94_9BURK|nr:MULTISPECIES: AAA family ATPase [Burkholderia cepacia complex]MBR8290504.1 AAA family ATPase [Burkholderia cenocepacia]ONU69321.1 hypothetical protein A8E62_05610 [Burkholderia cenocepacia]ONU94836.1 hypothetical protein A8E63_04775 [Burkholderia cenocepacia]VBB17441.1 hypothetical protein BSTAB16_7658 [Burkholderia stabilis]